jgi:hypothetical protein
MSILRTTVLSSDPTNSNTAEGDGGTQQQGQAFVTKQSLASFAGSTIAVTVVWKVADSLGLESRLVPLIAAIAIALILAYDTYKLTPAASRSGTLAMVLMIALLNALQVYLAVLGADVTLDQIGVAEPTNTGLPATGSD